MSRFRLALLLLVLSAGVVALYLAIGRAPAPAIEVVASAPAGEPRERTAEVLSEVAASTAARASSAHEESSPAADDGHLPTTVASPDGEHPGDSISGRVQWPDGRPVKGCRVEFKIQGERDEVSTRKQTSDADGTFVIRGLGTDPIALSATMLSPPAYAHIENVQPGTTGITLILRSDGIVSGRAVDDLGDPIDRFAVRVIGIDPPGNFSYSVWDTGIFVLGGLHDGTWELRGDSSGHARSTAHRIVLPGKVEPIDLVLPRSAVVSGIVSLPNGDAAVDARIRSVLPPGLRSFQFDEDGLGAQTDSDGRFVLKDLDPVAQRIVASKSNFADSEPFPVDLHPGERVSDTVLHLRLGGRILGELLDDSERPLPDRVVKLLGDSLRATDRDAHTDEVGKFEFPALAPGKYRLAVMPSDPELDAGKYAEVLRLAFERSARVDVVDGETTHVTLGGGKKAGIRVHGKVTLGSRQGRSVPSALLQFHSQDVQTGVSDEAGNYELFVDGPGLQQVTVSEAKDGSFFLDRVEIPPCKEFEHDIVLPGASVSGRVLLADGSSAPNVHVDMEPEERTAELMSSLTAASAETDDEGRFAIDGLKGGIYRLAAGDFPGPAHGSGQGSAVMSDLKLGEGERLEHVELRLQAPARIEGLVTGPDGKVLAGAIVFVRDESGEPVVRSYPPPTSDASGRFSIEGLFPCAVEIGARTEHLVTLESSRLILRAGETAKVQLAMHPGTKIRVLVQERDGRAVGASVRVFDPQGRLVGAAYPFRSDESEETPSPESGLVVGPVPPGRYKVTTTNHDRMSVSRDVSVSGDEQTVTLKFGE